MELDAPRDLFVEPALPQRMPVKLDPPLSLPPVPDYGAGPSLGPVCGTESAPASICGAKPSLLATGGGEFPPGVMGGSRSYTQLIGEIYQIKGELLNKAMPPDPMVPKLDCTLVLQLHMEIPEDSVLCFYPTPSVQETIPNMDVLNYGESLEVAGLLTCHH